MKARTGGYRRARKIRDRALILPLIGLALLTPPIALIFQSEAKLFGLPVTLIYLFAVWAALIVAARRQAGALRDTASLEDDAR